MADVHKILHKKLNKLQSTAISGNDTSSCLTPELIEELSVKWNIPKNFMFVPSPIDRFSSRVSDLGRVRLIM